MSLSEGVRQPSSDPSSRTAKSGDQAERISRAEAAPSSADDVERGAPTLHAVRGRVLDSDGQAVDGLRVRLRGEEQGTLTADGGVFLFETPAEKGQIEVAEPNWVSVRTGSWSLGGEVEPVVVVAQAIELEGRVADEWGGGVGRARVVLALPQDFEARFGYALDASFSEEWSTLSSDDGEFTLARMPAVSGAELRTIHDRYAPAVMDAPLATTRGMWIELRDPPVPEEHALRGVVLRLDGSPAQEAFVSMGLTTVRTRENGQFTLDLRAAENTERLQAVEAGQQPATLERPELPREGHSGWPQEVELTLGPPSLSISGRVLNDEGEPLAGGRVWVGDSSRFGAVGKIPVRLEALMAGGSIPKEAIESLAFDVGDPEGEIFGSARPLFEPDALVYWAETDDEGRFDLPGLSDRDYTLHVLDEQLHWGTISEPIAAGSRGVEIVVPVGVPIRPCAAAC